MSRKYVWLGLTAIFIIAVLAIFSVTAQKKVAFHSVTVDPPLPAPDINLTDDNGNVFQLSALRGKVVLIYFGFVNCPDECPLTMAHFKQALDMVGSAAKDVRVVMVSTDPVRDTPQALHDFLGKFDPTFIGIPGTPGQLASLWNAYGVTVLDGGETHSSYTYVVDKQGRRRLYFTPDSNPHDIAADLNILLAEK